MSSAGPVYIIDGNRTPFLKAAGKPGPFSAADLAVAAGRSLLARQPFSPEELSEVILGCVIPSPDEVNIARVVSQRLGCGVKVPAWTVQRNCGSGMQALETAADRIRDGHSSLVLAGGVEAMSHAPVQLNNEMVGWLGAWNRAKSAREKLRLLAALRPRHFRSGDRSPPRAHRPGGSSQHGPDGGNSGGNVPAYQGGDGCLCRPQSSTSGESL
jgi:acetyl-CoA C-acetyltransferase